MQRHQKGFSVMEILLVMVVIAVIGVLLLPVISSARQSADGAKCAGNLRQIGLGLFAYAGDRNGAIVPAAVIRSNYFWFDELNPYMGFPKYHASYSYPEPTAVGTAFPLAWQQCPARKESRLTREAVAYGWNYQNFGYKAANDTYNSHTNLRQIEEPSKTIIVGDSKDHETNPGTHSEYRYLYPKGGPALSERHQGRANYLMFDGHVERLRPSELPASSPFWKKYK